MWKAYRVTFTRPINQSLVLELDLLNLSARSAADLERLYLLCREGIVRALLPEYHLHRQATNRFFLGAILLSDPVIEVVRRELRRLSPGMKVQADEIKGLLIQDVIKREVVEGDEAEDAGRKVHRALVRALRTRQTKPEGEDNDAAAALIAEVESELVGE